MTVVDMHPTKPVCGTCGHPYGDHTGNKTAGKRYRAACSGRCGCRQYLLPDPKDPAC